MRGTESEISYGPFSYCENNPVNNSDEIGFLSSIIVAKIILNIAGYIFAWAYTKYRIRKDYRWRYTDALDLIAAIVSGLISAFVGQYVTGAIRKFAVAIYVGVHFYVYSMIWSGSPKNLKQVWKSTKEVIFNALF